MYKKVSCMLQVKIYLLHNSYITPNSIIFRNILLIFDALLLLLLCHIAALMTDSQKCE